MLEKLKQRWKVNSLNLILIIFTFALGGSLCGYAGKKILGLVIIDKDIVWVIAYLILITLLWPLCVLLISIPLGQFSFFKKYLLKIWARISGKKSSNIPLIAIFASGAGTNAQKIIDYFNINKTSGEVALIVCNKEGSGVLNIAKNHTIDTLLIEKEVFFNEGTYVDELKKRGIDLIILAGFLWRYHCH